MKEFVKDKKK